MKSKGETFAPRPKLVTTWEYVFEGVENPRAAQREGASDEDLAVEEEAGAAVELRQEQPRVGERRVQVQVYLLTTTRAAAAPPHPPAEVAFRVECKSPEFSAEGTDLEALRQAVFGFLDRELAIRWEKFFLVEVSPQHTYGIGLGAGLLFSYRDVERGTTHDGTLLLREYDSSRRSGAWKIAPWPGRFTNRQGKVIACIEGTPANRAALEEYTSRVGQLREVLALQNTALLPLPDSSKGGAS